MIAERLRSRARKNYHIALQLQRARTRTSLCLEHLPYHFKFFEFALSNRWIYHYQVALVPLPRYKYLQVQVMMRETSNLQNSKTPKRRNPKTQHDLISRSRLTVILSTQTSKHRYQYRYRYFLVPATPRTHFLPYPPLPLLTSHFSLPNLYRNECTQTLKPLSHSRSLGTTNNFKPFSNRQTSNLNLRTLVLL